MQIGADGLLTVPDFQVTPDGNRLVVLEQAGETPTSLNVTVVGTGSVTVEPEKATYAYGDEITLIASAASGWKFDGWSGGVTGEGTAMAMVVAGDERVTATFVSISSDVYLPLVLK